MQVQTQEMQIPEPNNATFIDYIKGELDIWSFQSPNEVYFSFFENQMDYICGMEKSVAIEELDETEMKLVSTSTHRSETCKASSSESVIPSDLVENKNAVMEPESTVEIVTHDKHYAPQDDLYFGHYSKETNAYTLYSPQPSVTHLDKSTNRRSDKSKNRLSDISRSVESQRSGYVVAA